MRKIYLLFFAILLSVNIYSQANFYTFSQSNGTYVPITGGTLVTSSTNGTPSLDSYVSNSINIPPFNLGGVQCTSMKVTANGSILFNITAPP